jgi:hypothetical protein
MYKYHIRYYSVINDKYHTWYDLMLEVLLSYHLPVSRRADPEIVRVGFEYRYYARRFKINCLRTKPREK